MAEGFSLGTGGAGRVTVYTGGTGKYEGLEGGGPYEAVYAPKIGEVIAGHTVGSYEYSVR